MDSEMTISENSEPLRVLHVIGAMDRGGAETLIMNVYRTMNRDAIQFDFLVHKVGKADYDDEIEGLGGRIYRLDRFTGLNYFAYKHSACSFFDNHRRYLAVHVHIGSCAPIILSAAKSHGMPTIAHSHNTNSPDTLSELPFRLVSYPTRFLADYYLACSKQAGLDRFGTRVVSSNRFQVLKNGINASSFRFDQQKRICSRAALGFASDDYVIGNVARLTSQKNQSFLLDAFSEARADNPRLKLLLIGRGEDETNLKDKVEILGLHDCVKFLGVREDIPELMAAMDCFAFPSKWEGFGIVALEAQASGLPCLLSDQLPEMVFLSTRARRLPVKASDVAAWSEALLRSSRQELEGQRKLGYEIVKEAGFDIKDVAATLTNLYLFLSRDKLK